MAEHEKFRFHVVALPHSQTTKEYSVCAFNSKVRKFCDMMKSLGHTVFLYAGDQNEAECDELITCMTRAELGSFFNIENWGPEHILLAPFDWTMPHWQVMNRRVIEGIQERKQPKDFICIIGGLAHKPVADAFPDLMTVEFGIGYPGTFSKYRVFETYAWMHTTYGSDQGNAGAVGNFYDRVIPSYFEPEDFPFRDKKDDYFLFTGRLIERKGVQIAIEVAERLDKRLVVLGQGDIPNSPIVDYRGLAGPEERGKWMSGAKAGFVPTLYVEPFGSVAPETMMCGTPVITSDFGAFPELVEQGKTGWRCRTLSDFIYAAKHVESLDPRYIRDYAIERWSMNNVRWQYQRYFDDLMTLWGNGWYTKMDRPPAPWG